MAGILILLVLWYCCITMLACFRTELKNGMKYAPNWRVFVGYWLWKQDRDRKEAGR